MPQKKKNQGTHITPKSWPNLPQHLINKIAAQPNLMQSISSSACVTKSWRSPSKKCSRPAGKPQLFPQLVEIEHGGGDDARRPHRFGIAFHEACPYPYWYRKRKEYMHEDIYFAGILKGHSHGQVVVMDANKSDFYLWNPATQSTTGLPPWKEDHLHFKLCTLSSSSSSSPRSSNAMVVTGSSSLAFFSSGGSWEWVVEDFDVDERYGDPGKKMEFVNAIGFEGKFYALSLQGSVVVIEDVGGGSCFGVTRVGGNRGLPSRVCWRRFREYLVECDGGILVVFLGSRKGMDVVDDVEVFRLDVGEVLWVEVEGIGDWALFVEDECCMGVDARKVGCKRNCVYFTHHRVGNWWVFDMATRKISPFQESVMWDDTARAPYQRWTR